MSWTERERERERERETERRTEKERGERGPGQHRVTMVTQSLYTVDRIRVVAVYLGRSQTCQIHTGNSSARRLVLSVRHHRSKVLCGRWLLQSPATSRRLRRGLISENESV